MANELLRKNGLQFLLRDATDFPNSGAGPPTTAANSLIIGTPTEVQIDLTGIAATGGARQSAKMDLTTPWGVSWTIDACIEFETAPADGGSVDFYWAKSPSATAGTGNAGGTTGADAAFTDTAGNLGQMVSLGSLPVRNNVINIGSVGLLTPTLQYGNLVVVNNASTAFRSTATAMDETHIVITEVIDELQ
jgi:hypothetical protein